MSNILNQRVMQANDEIVLRHAGSACLIGPLDLRYGAGPVERYHNWGPDICPGSSGNLYYLKRVMHLRHHASAPVLRDSFSAFNRSNADSEIIIA